MAEVKILPVVQRDGTALRGLSAPVESIEVRQVVGGRHNGEQGSWSELTQGLECEGVTHQNGTQEGEGTTRPDDRRLRPLP